MLPAAGESNWWFLDDGFWAEYLDLMAHARLNFLDLHGMYNLDNTIFPNALLYFATAKSQPDVGAAPAERARNVAMLARIVERARVRGIRTGFMTYRSDNSPLGDGKPPALGFRVGESGHPAAWYNDTFAAGALAASTGVQLCTRSWYASKQDVTTLAGPPGAAWRYPDVTRATPYVVLAP